jgi:hypothetical protein
MHHLWDFLLSALTVLIALFVYGWLASNASSPLAGKI